MNKTRTHRFLGILLLCAATVAAFFLMQSARHETSSKAPIHVTEFHFDTVITVTIYDSSDTSLLDGCMDLCREYEDLFSRTKETSEIYKLNHGLLEKEGDFYILSDQTADLIRKGLEYSRLSDGAFDITIAPVSSLWNFSSETPHVPQDSQIQEALSYVGWKNIDLQGNRIRFLKEGMQIDLGGIAKGYIADGLKTYLLSQGVKSAIINLGGNILCVGEKPDETPFTIGIQKPFALRNETLASVSLSDQSVVSSGTYERNFEENGKFYHHILNPKTGYPYDNHLVSVTIFSDDSVDGDGLSTSCFALGLEKGMEFIDSLSGIYALFVTDDGELHYSEGLLENFSVTVTK